MTEVKEQFKEAASKQTTTLGWKFIFDKYDDDGSGELDIEEFRQCVRHECKLTQEECSDDDVVELFCIVDADESGAIDATELRTFLTTDLEAASMTFAPFMASVFELTALWVPTESEGQYARFLQLVFIEISEPVGDGQSAAELSQLPVYNEERDADGNLVPNFRLRPLDQVCCRLCALCREPRARPQSDPNAVCLSASLRTLLWGLKIEYVFREGSPYGNASDGFSDVRSTTRVRAFHPSVAHEPVRVGRWAL